MCRRVEKKRKKRAATKKRKGERAACDCVQREEENCNGSVRICVIKCSEWWCEIVVVCEVIERRRELC